MNIGVCLKQTFDTEANVVLNAEGKVSREDVKLIINPYDEFAIEEALRIKEKFGGQVTVVSMGPATCKDSLKLALAMGCDKAVNIFDEDAEKDEYAAVKLLAKYMGEQNFDIIIGGARSVDNTSCQVMPRIAAALKIPFVDLATKVEMSETGAVITHDVDGGEEIVEVAVPFAFSAQKNLNEPRVANTRGMLQAKKKPQETINASDLVVVANKTKEVENTVPPARTAGVVVKDEAGSSIEGLVNYLKNDIKVI